MRPALLIVLLLAVVVGDAFAAGKRLKKPRRGFQMRVGEFTVNPSQDLEVCEYRRLPNEKPMDVSGFELRMPEGAHHFVIWTYTGNETDDTKFPEKPVESVGCTGVSPDEIIPAVLIPIQQPNARFQFPKGIAMRIDAHQQVWLNPHMKNAGTEAIRPDVRFNFLPAKKGSVRHRVDGLIIGNMTDIRIPANGQQTLTAEWTAPVDMTLVYLATHQHRLGTYANIQVVDPDGVTPRTIYENDDWEHPRSLWPEPALRLEKGRKIRITCTWQNTETRTVTFGPETTDEMCFILGFFYRDDGDEEPFRSRACVSAKRGVLCPLAPALRP